jgi:hypothetical protein
MTDASANGRSTLSLWTGSLEVICSLFIGLNDSLKISFIQDDRFRRCEFISFTSRLVAGLVEEGYYNAIHAADVTQAMHCFLETEFIHSAIHFA